MLARAVQEACLADAALADYAWSCVQNDAATRVAEGLGSSAADLVERSVVGVGLTQRREGDGALPIGSHIDCRVLFTLPRERVIPVRCSLSECWPPG